MMITKEFLEGEIARLSREQEQARSFVVAAQGAMDGYRALIDRVLAPEPVPATVAEMQPETLHGVTN